MKAMVRIFKIFGFVAFYLFKLVESNLIVAWDIITPKMKTKPGFMTYDIRLQSNFGILLFSNLVSMTPGTLSVDLTNDKKKLLVHVLYLSNEDKIRSELDTIQQKIQQIT